MLKVRGYDIYFKHKPLEQGYTTNTINGREVETEFIGLTECVIEKDKELQSEGQAFCSVNDRYVKSTGRKISLQRAIAHLDREFRKEIWEAYLKETSHL